MNFPTYNLKVFPFGLFLVSRILFLGKLLLVTTPAIFLPTTWLIISSVNSLGTVRKSRVKPPRQRTFSRI